MRPGLPVVSFVCLAALAQPAFAESLATALAVKSASADGGVLSIRGVGFGDVAPYVALAGMPLVVLSSSGEEIDAQLPDAIPPGSYLLVVARNPLRTPYGFFNVTIGAAGPQGERGPMGDRGPQGPPGLQGPPGPDVTAQIAALQTQVLDLNTRLAVLEAKLARVSVSGDEITITGANLRVTSGSGSTDGPVNGLGNLIVGYNELRGAGDNRTGSHNLVVGSRNNYTSYGGFVGGFQTGVTAPFSTAIAAQAFDLRATATFGLRASTLNLDSDLSMNLRAGSNFTAIASNTLSLRGSFAADLQASGNLVLRGSTVQIN